MWSQIVRVCVFVYFVTLVTTSAEDCKDDKCMNSTTEVSNNLNSTKENLSIEDAKGRAINFTASEPRIANTISANNGSVMDVTARIMTGTSQKKPKHKDLSDVSMDEDEDEDMFSSVQHLITTTKQYLTNNDSGVCTDGGKTYQLGDRVERGCTETCTCKDGAVVDCAPRCNLPHVRKGKFAQDPLCTEKESDDPCCAIVVCASDTETEPLEMCTYSNKTYHRGEVFKEDCKSICTCEHSGKVVCKPRCPATETKKNMSDRCVTVPDPQDSCCKRVLCDVELDDSESPHMDLGHQDISTFHVPRVNDNNMPPSMESSQTDPGNSLQELNVYLSAEAVNSTAVRLSIEAINASQLNTDNVEVSEDQQTWNTRQLFPQSIVTGFMPGKAYYIKMGDRSNIAHVVLPLVKQNKTDIQMDEKKNEINGTCTFKGHNYKDNEEFHDGCSHYCMCKSSGDVHCAKIECPTNFGLDVVDPHCLEWEPIPADFVPIPPRCCAEKVHCKNNGSCVHEGVTYANFADVPSEGCHRRCYCENGQVECHDACPPVTAQPPSDLPCEPNQATVSKRPDDDCCLYWVCADEIKNNTGVNQGFPPNFPLRPNFNVPTDEISVIQLEALTSNSVRVAFTVPQVMVGLHGRVELRYTDQPNNNNPATWELQIFAPPDDILATPQLEFELAGLKPDTEYRVKIILLLRDLRNTPSSRVHTVRTLPVTTSTNTGGILPTVIPVDPKLNVLEVNATSITVQWRPWAETEAKLIDGVQLRYREENARVFAASPLLHRAVTSYTLDGLRPNTAYEITISLIPFPTQHAELHSDSKIRVVTQSEIDIYGFNVTLDINHVKSTNVEIAWTGVPYPQDKYVNVYRAVYQIGKGSGGGREAYSTFKIAKRDAPATTIISDLKPATKYRLWLELYLTNGRIKTSNVKDFTTKDGAPVPLDHDAQQGKLAGISEISNDHGDYYGPMVAVCIIAVVAILATVILLLMLVKRHGHNKAAISPPTPRVSQASYDNPTYKAELQQETMNL